MLLNSVLVIGGAHIDRKGTMSAPYMKGSSIPGTMLEFLGGSAFNIAINLARLDHDVTFISPRADSGFDHKIENVTKNIAHFFDKPVFMPGHTPSYTALLDQHGELIAALADMDFYDQMEPDQFLTDALIRELRDARTLITDGNLPAEMLKEISSHLSDNCRWFAVATSPAKVIRYRSVLDRLHLLSMNINEAIAVTNIQDTMSMQELTQHLSKIGLPRAIITDGTKPAVYFNASSAPIICDVPKADKIVDVTGAGDATLSAFVAAILNGKSAKHALQDGLAAAFITIQSQLAQSDELNLENLEKTRRKIFPSPGQPNRKAQGKNEIIL